MIKSSCERYQVVKLSALSSSFQSISKRADRLLLEDGNPLKNNLKGHCTKFPSIRLKFRKKNSQANHL